MGVQFHTLGVYHKGMEGQTGRKTSPEPQGLPPAPWEGWEPARVEATVRGEVGVIVQPERKGPNLVRAVSCCLFSNHEVQGLGKMAVYALLLQGW